MKRPLLLTALSLASVSVFSSGKELDGIYSPAQNACPSVEEAIKKMKVPDGYEVRNFASEPDVINPVAMTWDHRGRLWVVELYEYPRGAKNPNEYSKIAIDEKFRPVVKTDANSPRDRVLILEDTDNDGKADKRTVFAEGLNLATGILCGYDGVFIGQAPNLFFFRDTNGDDKADEYKTVLTGFGLEDRHELLNGFTWGPDGYLYFTHGVFTHSKIYKPAEPKEKGNTLNAGVYRVNFSLALAYPTDPAKSENPAYQLAPTVHTHEVFADGTSNPWGVDFDASGNAFVSACVIDHLFHMAPGGLYQRQGGAPENPYAYELLPSIVSHKHFRAAYAGLQVYQGGIYPPDTHGHVFMGNIHDNAVHEESLTPVGATFKAAPVRDFLRANDGWFRPVSTQTGPDGFLWVMDWCDKYPCYQNAQANPEGVDRERGRIWRVCYTGSDEGKRMAGKSRQNEVDLIAKPPATLELLKSSNNWIAKTAAIRFKQSYGNREGSDHVALQKRLLAMIRSTKSAPVKLRVLWLLAGISVFSAEAPDSVFDDPLFFELAKDPDPAVRTIAARFVGEYVFGHPDQGKLLDMLAQLARDKSSVVRHAVAVAARRYACSGMTLDTSWSVDNDPPHASDYSLKIIEALMEGSRSDADTTLAFAVWMDLAPYLRSEDGRCLELIGRVAARTKPLSHVLTYKTARRVTDTRSAEYMDLLLAFLDKIKDDDVLTAHALDGMLKAQEAGPVKPAKTDPAPFFARWAASTSADVRNHAGRLATLWGDKTAVAGLIKLAEDPNTDAARRAEAIKTLRKLNSDEARAALLRILEKAVPQ